jgi:uncharacterized membrane protein
MKQDRINRAEWANPNNWNGGLFGIYFSKRDSRVWVPKRQPLLGWTINLAHPRALWWMAAFALIPLIGGVIQKLRASDDDEPRRSADHW